MYEYINNRAHFCHSKAVTQGFIPRIQNSAVLKRLLIDMNNIENVQENVVLPRLGGMSEAAVTFCGVFRSTLKKGSLQELDF